MSEYYHVTGNPVLLPEYAFYEGHLNAYNRDSWSDTEGGKGWTIKGNEPYTSAGTTKYESGMSTGYKPKDGMNIESLNGTKPTVGIENYPKVEAPYKYSARQVIDDYFTYDMPVDIFSQMTDMVRDTVRTDMARQAALIMKEKALRNDWRQ